MIIVGRIGAAQLEYDREFSLKMKEEGVRDPIKTRMELFKKKCHFGEDGSITCEFNPGEKDPLEPTREEIDAWIERRDRYIATRIFENFGYSAIADGVYDKFAHEFIPCKGGDGQCHMDCYMKGSCKQ